MRVDLKIDPSKLTLTLSGGKWEGAIDLMVLCGDTQRRVVGRLDQRMQLSMDQARYEQAKSSGIPYVAMVPLTGTAAHVKVLVYDYDSDRLGATYVPVR